MASSPSTCRRTFNATHFFLPRAYSPVQVAAKASMTEYHRKPSPTKPSVAPDHHRRNQERAPSARAPLSAGTIRLRVDFATIFDTENNHRQRFDFRDLALSPTTTVFFLALALTVPTHTVWTCEQRDEPLYSATIRLNIPFHWIPLLR